MLKYGTMYQNIDTKKESVYMFTSLFLLRRFIHAFSTVFFGNKSLVVSTYFNTFSSLYLISFYLKYKPLKDKTSNRVELFNEMVIFFSNYCFILLTDFVPEVE